MADNDLNDDEYKFDEFESIDHDMLGQSDKQSDAATDLNQTSTTPEGAVKKDVMRNAFIAISLILGVIICYKMTMSFVLDKKDNKSVVANNSELTSNQMAQTPPAAQPVVAAMMQQPSVQPLTVASTGDNTALTRKVSDIEIAQQNIRADVGTMGQQVSDVNNNVNNLNNQIVTLNQMVNNLSNQLAKQTEELNVLMVRTQAKAVVKARRVGKKVHHQHRSYHIQALIPGRAWLIASNGSTLTVRDGTKIPGYGMVKLIDSIQGRVVTSSGKVIQFSQEDS